MCGIAGFVLKRQIKDPEERLERMLSTIVHRGPDGEGKRIFEGRMALGHRRLAIIDLTDKGLQPMQWDNKYWITYNGEIYNYLELREELIETAGYRFTTDTDTEVILAAYEKWGYECVTRFNGMWSFVIYDLNRKVMFCARDRFGVKPFYYSLNKDGFIFASEIKEILSYYGGNYRPRVNKVNLEAFLLRGVMDTDAGTMFKDIFQIEGGCSLVVDVNSITAERRKWYDLRRVKLNNNSEVENSSLFKKHFYNSIALRLRADVPVGSCLSGGLDSSAIVCCANQILRRKGGGYKQYTVTSCFDDAKYDEQEYADTVVQKTEAIAYKVYPNLDLFFDKLDRIIWHMDEPFISMSIFAQWEVFREAQKHGLTVMLDGQGADEQLGGYAVSYDVLFYELIKKRRFRRLHTEIKKMEEYTEKKGRVEMLGRLMSIIVKGIVPKRVKSCIKLIYEFACGALPYKFTQYGNELILKYEYLCSSKNASDFICGSINTVLNALLHYEDRNSMAHSIEARVPFLDVDLVEFIYSVPFEQKIVDGKTKNILREGTKDDIPDKVYRRYRKLGFVTPQDKWILDNQDIIEAEFKRGCTKLSKVINTHKVYRWYMNNRFKKKEQAGVIAFRVICASHWMDVFGVTA